MICGNCGANNADNATFCHSCGESFDDEFSFDDAETPVPYNYSRNTKTRRTNLLPLIGILAVVIAAALLAFFLLTGRSYQAAIDQFGESLVEGDVDQFMDLIPKKTLEYMTREEDLTRKDFQELMDVFHSAISFYEGLYGGTVDMKFELGDKDTIIHYQGTELEKIQKTYEETGVKVSAAIKVPTTMVIILSKDGNENNFDQAIDIPLIKVGNKWYIDFTNMV